MEILNKATKELIQNAQVQRGVRAVLDQRPSAGGSERVEKITIKGQGEVRITIRPVTSR